MAVNKPRNRTLIFRLTQDEYDYLQAASSGARSLSDFARERLLRSIERLTDRSATHGTEAARGANRGTAGEGLMRIILLFISAVAAIAQNSAVAAISNGGRRKRKSALAETRRGRFDRGVRLRRSGIDAYVARGGGRHDSSAAA